MVGWAQRAGFGYEDGWKTTYLVRFLLSGLQTVGGASDEEINQIIVENCAFAHF